MDAKRRSWTSRHWPWLMVLPAGTTVLISMHIESNFRPRADVISDIIQVQQQIAAINSEVATQQLQSSHLTQTFGGAPSAPVVDDQQSQLQELHSRLRELTGELEELNRRAAAAERYNRNGIIHDDPGI